MKKVLLGVVCFVLILFSVTVLHASEDPMYDFYNGLADILESGINSPEVCVSQAETHIKKYMQPLVETAKRGQKAAEAQMQNMQNVDPAQSIKQGQKALEEVMKSKGFQAMTRFMNAMQEFSMQHPDQAEEIMETMAEIEPRQP